MEIIILIALWSSCENRMRKSLQSALEASLILHLAHNRCMLTEDDDDCVLQTSVQPGLWVCDFRVRTLTGWGFQERLLLKVDAGSQRCK